MKMNYKRTLKLLTLLVSALVIGAVSAQVYLYMYIEGSGTITTGGLSWEKGTTAPSGSTVQGTYVHNLNLSILADTPMNFTDCLHLKNNDASSHTFGLEATVTGGNTSKFTTFDMVVYKADWTKISKISIKNSETASSLTIAASETLYIRFEVDPVIGETTGYMAFTVKLTYE